MLRLLTVLMLVCGLMMPVLADEIADVTIVYTPKPGSPAGLPTGYHLLRQIGSGPWLPLTDLKADGLYTDDTALPAGVLVCYKAQPFNEAGAARTPTGEPLLSPPGCAPISVTLDIPPDGDTTVIVRVRVRVPPPTQPTLAPTRKR